MTSEVSNGCYLLSRTYVYILIIIIIISVVTVLDVKFVQTPQFWFDVWKCNVNNSRISPSCSSPGHTFARVSVQLDLPVVWPYHFDRYYASSAQSSAFRMDVQFGKHKRLNFKAWICELWPLGEAFQPWQWFFYLLNVGPEFIPLKFNIYIYIHSHISSWQGIIPKGK